MKKLATKFTPKIAPCFRRLVQPLLWGLPQQGQSGNI